HLLRDLFRDRDAQLLPVRALVVAARAGEPRVALPVHAGPARRDGTGDHSPPPGQAVVGLPEPLPLAGRALAQARRRTSVGVRPHLVRLGTADNWIPQHPELVSVALGLRVRP